MLLLYILLLIPVSHSVNIFAGALFGGSHLTAVYDLALILADAGHNVTFVNVVSGGLDKLTKHPNLHGLDMIMWDKQSGELMWKECFASAVVKAEPGELTSAECVELWAEVFRRSASVYTGDRVLDMFSEVGFEVILGEKTDTNGMALLGAVTGVPVVHFEPSFLIQLSLIRGNLPLLVTSQPSMMYNQGFDHPPTFLERISVFKNFLAILPFLSMGEKIMQPFLEKFSFSTLQDVEDSVKLFLTNDHPAFTFPYLRPGNDIPIGCANLLGSKQDPVQFPSHIEQFLADSSERDVVYVSFGSYIKVSEVPWYAQLIDILIELDLRIIVRVDKNFDKLLPKSVLPLSWAPQKDLLRSGKVKLFISHCGNNGRLETIFYNVPVLCIPQIVDQPVCAEVIKLNGFGESLLAKDVPVLAKDLVLSMLANHSTYQDKMKRASDVVENEPGSVKENLVFYVEYLAKFKNVDFLVNKVIKQQSFVEIHNLDIIIPATLVLILITGTIMFVTCKCFIHMCHKLSIFSAKRHKNE